MANDEDVARLRQGVDAWNAWRAQNRDRRTDLSEADLRGADLIGAILSEANLSRAILTGTNLIRAILSEANLSGARLYETVLANVDLSTTKGLDTCDHCGPSVLDHRTLQRSGRLPLAFLRGCGLPDRLIDYLPSLLDEAIQYYSCFISYSSKDDAFANPDYSSRLAGVA